MTVYLHDFRFRSIDEEEKMLDREKRTCFNSGWPFGLFPRKGLGRMEFEAVTILHGGNGSGKSTALNVMAARLGVLRKLPSTSHFFEWYVNGVAGGERALAYNSELPPELRPVPEGSRFLASEDVFDRTLAVRGRNREIGREPEQFHVSCSGWQSKKSNSVFPDSSANASDFKAGDKRSGSVAVG